MLLCILFIAFYYRILSERFGLQCIFNYGILCLLFILVLFLVRSIIDISHSSSDICLLFRLIKEELLTCL